MRPAFDRKRLVDRKEVTKHTGIIFGMDFDNPYLPTHRDGTKTVCTGGPQFVIVTLPPAWEKEYIDLPNGYQFLLRDEKERVRAKGFYMPHIVASMTFASFYKVEYFYHDNNDKTHHLDEELFWLNPNFEGEEFVSVIIRDGFGKEIRRIGTLSSAPDKSIAFEGRKAGEQGLDLRRMVQEGEAWLKRNHPKSDDIWAYW